MKFVLANLDASGNGVLKNASYKIGHDHRCGCRSCTYVTYVRFVNLDPEYSVRGLMSDSNTE